MTVIDASVAVALVNALDKEHTACWAWFERAWEAEEPIHAPAILLAEVAAALSRGVGDIALAHRVVRQLARSGLVELVPVTLMAGEQAAAIAADHRIRGCDAIYVALAGELGEPLVTLDRQQLERGAAVVAVQTP
jgi:predicted nucleic acid-binding protein